MVLRFTEGKYLTVKWNVVLWHRTFLPSQFLMSTPRPKTRNFTVILPIDQADELIRLAKESGIGGVSPYLRALVMDAIHHGYVFVEAPRIKKTTNTVD